MLGIRCSAPAPARTTNKRNKLRIAVHQPEAVSWRVAWRAKRTSQPRYAYGGACPSPPCSPPRTEARSALPRLEEHASPLAAINASRSAKAVPPE